MGWRNCEIRFETRSPRKWNASAWQTHVGYCGKGISEWIQARSGGCVSPCGWPGRSPYWFFTLVGRPAHCGGNGGMLYLGHVVPGRVQCYRLPLAKWRSRLWKDAAANGCGGAGVSGYVGPSWRLLCLSERYGRLWGVFVLWWCRKHVGTKYRPGQESVTLIGKSKR